MKLDRGLERTIRAIFNPSSLESQGIMIRSIVFVIVWFFAQDLVGQDPTTEKRKFDELTMELFRNSPTASQALALNNHGSIVGTRELPEAETRTLRPMPFYSGKHGTKNIPIPATYTNFEVVGISDNEVVIGYATRPLMHKDGTLRGFVWNPESEEFTALPQADGDVANHAQDISADGKRISGYTTGPARLRPAVWELQDETKQWKITVLPTKHDNNPYLMSSHLLISPDGKTIAGCCTDEFLPDGILDSSLYVWMQNNQGAWERKNPSQEQILLRGLNDLGEIAGSFLTDKGQHHPCLMSPEGKLLLLDLLPGDVSGEAFDINNASIIVGLSDDPHGPEGGPELCIWSKDGKAKSIRKSGACYGAIHAINASGQMAGMIEVTLENPKDPATDDLAEGIVLAFRTVP